MTHLPALRTGFRDPRHYQIAVLGTLLVYGITQLDLEVRLTYAAAMLVTALLVQYACGRL